MALTKEETAELFLLQVRGGLAMAFSHSGVLPTNDDWCILRGVDDPTLRDIGEIAGRTGYRVSIALNEDAPRPEASHDQ